MYEYRESRLWQAAFNTDNAQTPYQKAAIERLIEAYQRLESRVKPLIENIPQDCHGLTIHDISHCHQLWSVADQICGDNYSINPLEGFVLGAAFLIHDAGLTAAAYPGGLTAIRECSLYKDILSYKRRSQDRDKNRPDSTEYSDTNIEKQTLFETLRELHALRAERLLELKFRHPLVNFDYNLIDDLDLYLDCGDIIGLIAASHHWTFKKLSDRFGDPLTPPAAFSWWTIDAFKLACILRCSDACAIDERRARIMPFILLQPSGVSLDHWDFQARLKPGLLRNGALLFESKIAFNRDNMSSWWTAFDSVSVADRELRDCDKEIRVRIQRQSHHDLKRFAAINAEGANDPERLKQFIKVTGWLPVDTAVRIGNPVSLIEKLGGWALYGNDLIAPARELIQNAADAIRAREHLGTNTVYKGIIEIDILIDEKSDLFSPCKIVISDNGIGMPPEIMHGTLLNFGESLWTSPRLPFTYPGLSTNTNFRPTGQFGIGFYSVFMIADQVSVTSRTWEDGVKCAKTLHFQQGVRSRAELRDFDEKLDTNYVGDRVTSVELNISRPTWIQYVSQQSSSVFDEDDQSKSVFWSNFELTFSRLVFALGVECRLKIGSSAPKTINNTDIFLSSNTEFADRYNNIMIDKRDQRRKLSDSEIPLIRIISSNDGSLHSRGIIDVKEDRGWIHVGGLSVFNRADGLIKGIVACHPGTAARQGGYRVASKAELQEWASQQLRLVFEHELSNEERLAAVAAASTIDVDVSSDALMRVNEDILNIRHYIKSIDRRINLLLPIDRDPLSRKFYEISSNSARHGISLSDIGDLKFDGIITGNHSLNNIYCRISKDLSIESNPNTLFSILIESLKEYGYVFDILGPRDFFLGNYTGPDGGRGRLLDRNLKTGDSISSWGISIEISLTD
ncbi:HD domain-containing protein [Bosea robiniae]|uniref:Histidine kinase-, DNA gyrase B-, and HSP90-like ATPase n=1 Tax=Bosea robiniae TaxID=1036780 RepID=A0ABY0P8V3_9HYPH|nr:ATP-binding protein [Bosea robiniae]SDG98916.1 Histidine kinase-, DNA gyrase B-, and HSP90-like ATPase [Bosea robiniae]